MELELKIALDRIADFVKAECGLGVSFYKSTSSPRIDNVVVHSSSGHDIATISAIKLTASSKGVVGLIETKIKRKHLKIKLFNKNGTFIWDVNEVDKFLVDLKSNLVSLDNE